MLFPDSSLLASKLQALYQAIIAIREDDAYLKSIGAYGSDMSIELWDWSQGVGLYGIWRLYESTGEPRYLDYLHGWYARHIAEAAVKNVNHVAPMLTLVSMCQTQADARWQALIQEYGDWLMHELIRTEMGGFTHTTATRNNEQQLWVDTLFMSGLFLAKAGRLLARRDWCDEVRYQFLLHAQFLIEPARGLWRHGWHFAEKHHFSGALWGRGNGWAALTAIELLDILSDPCPAQRLLIQNYQRHCQALLAMQADNGMWHTLLNDRDSYQEASATAAIACALLKGARLGVLDKRYQQAGLHALHAVLSRINPEGELADVSSGTPVFHTVQEYKDVPIKQRSYGQSLAMLALAEGLLHS